MQKRKLGDDVPMSGVPSEMADHPTKSMDSDALFGEGRALNIPTASVFISSPAMKPSLSLGMSKRGFEDSGDMWTRIDSAMEWDLRSPENVELDELDGMFDDF